MLTETQRAAYANAVKTAAEVGEAQQQGIQSAEKLIRDYPGGQPVMNMEQAFTLISNCISSETLYRQMTTDMPAAAAVSTQPAAIDLARELAEITGATVSDSNARYLALQRKLLARHESQVDRMRAWLKSEAAEKAQLDFKAKVIAFLILFVFLPIAFPPLFPGLRFLGSMLFVGFTIAIEAALHALGLR